jgi:hypothetical protein
MDNIILSQTLTVASPRLILRIVWFAQSTRNKHRERSLPPCSSMLPLSLHIQSTITHTRLR